MNNLKTTLNTSAQFKTGCGAIAMVFFTYLMFRNAGLHAVVMADEWYYSSFSRLLPLSDASIPSYFYLLVSRFTRSCGSGFLECARLFNVLVFMSAAPCIYLVGRRFLSPAAAALVTICALAGPINSYTVYFMPEAMYFSGFWLLTLAAFRFSDAPGPRRAFSLGAVLGVMTLIKLHGLFLLPACVIFIAYCVHAAATSTSSATTMRRVGACLAALLATVAVIRFAGGFLLAGKDGLHLMGALYGNQAASTGGHHTPILELLRLALFNLRGHAFGLALLLGMPVAASLAYVAKLRKPGVWRNPHTALALYTALMLLSLLAVTILFTASVAGGGQDSNVRLHMRYYNFCLPLLMLMAAMEMRTDIKTMVPPSVRAFIALCISATIVYAALTLWRPYTPSFVDSPELQGMTAWRQGFYGMSCLALAAVLLWAYRPRLGARVFFLGFMPVFLLIAGYAINRDVTRGAASNQFDQAGAFAREYLTAAERARLAIVTDDGSGMFRTQFYVDDARVFQHMAAQGSIVDRNALPPSIEWILFVGSYPAPAGAAVRVQARGFSLVEVSPPSAEHFSVDLSKPDGANFSSKGLSGIEPWGRWSDGDTIQFDFKQALPKKFKLGLLMEAYGPNAGEMATVTVGGMAQRALIEKTKKLVELEFVTDGKASTIAIAVPRPTSPHDVNGSEDRRRIGIGLGKLTVDATPD